ncbi:porin [Pseudoduganella namucuonensis]|uniref:Outer membrane protein (Porin) n=1 Tax=Pseudoduganella namucuonensis TaxID=1035707 RepID=A0A1I7IWV8_9BURK|nr:porin [Pseudoduganella namucuonensis]SFU77394.1 Outer membrane protein (porin) [Pseudoduganella namucuonensis]
MNKSTLALAVLALAAGAAQAQSNVQVYGLIDAGVENASNASAGGGSMTRVVSGGMNTSRWGLRGSEDLGGGLKAVFQLEGGILLDTGAQDGALFRRQANVGLEGSFGRVVLGRSFSSVYDTVISYDPMGFAPLYSWATSGPATGPSKYGFTTGFDNLVKYSGSTGAFKYGLTYGFGEQSTGAGDSRKIGTNVQYNKNGLGLMATWERINGNLVPATGNRDENTVYHLGANYETGPLKFFGVMRNYTLQSGRAATADVKATTVWGGVAYKPQPNVTITGAVYHVNVKNVAAGRDADPTMYVARYRYALSKRTDLYVAAAYAKAKNGQLTGLSRDDAGFDTNQRGVVTGIQHRF